MRQIYGRKVIALTRGGLTDVEVGKKNPNLRSKACRKKSAEAIVPEKKKKREGPNNRKS